MPLDPRLGYAAAYMHPPLDAISFAGERDFDHIEVKINGEAVR
jgi:hypothetical protein